MSLIKCYVANYNDESFSDAGTKGTRSIDGDKTICCYFGKILGEGYAVEWTGHGAILFIHPACTLDLTFHLIGNVHDYEKATGKRAQFSLNG